MQKQETEIFLRKILNNLLRKSLFFQNIVFPDQLQRLAWFAERPANIWFVLKNIFK